MKSKLVSTMLVVGVLLCLLVIVLLGSNKGVHFTEAAGRSSVGFLVVAVSLVLPIISFRSARTRVRPHRALLSPVFITTLLPVVIILCLVVDAAFVRFPGHIFPSDSGKISVGMTRAHVTPALRAARTRNDGPPKPRGDLFRSRGPIRGRADAGEVEPRARA